MSVDEELSSLVKRDFSLVSCNTNEAKHGTDGGFQSPTVNDVPQSEVTKSMANLSTSDENNTVLKVYYRATTPRMLRVAVNGFFESLGLIIQVMEELDVDVLHEKGIEGLEGVQGVEQGLTRTAVGVGG